jgi:rhomboid protease GluP
MFKRQTSGSVVCASCGYLVGVRDATCYHCGRRNPGLWGYAPALRSLGNDLGFVPFVTFLCGIVYALTLLKTGPSALGGGLFSILSPSGDALIYFGASGAYPVFVLGRWLTLLSASWLHGSLLHIFFNMMWVRQLGPAVAEMFGPGRMVIIYTAGGVGGFLASTLAAYVFAVIIPIPFLATGGVTVGASAAIFGLLGSLVYYGRRAGSSAVGAQAWNYAIILFVMGFVMRGVDNYAHAGGYVGGWLAARFLDPLQPERVNHMLMAVICLAASALSILVSLYLSATRGINP